MSDFGEAVYYLMFLIGIPVIFSISQFAWSLRVGQRYRFAISLTLVIVISAASFYVFRLIYVIILSIQEAVTFGTRLSDSLSRIYNDLFGWYDTAASLSYVLDGRLEIHFPEDLYFRQWHDVSAMELFYYLSLAIVIVFAANLLKSGRINKIGAFILLLPMLVFHLYVIAHWMYLAMHL